MTAKEQTGRIQHEALDAAASFAEALREALDRVVRVLRTQEQGTSEIIPASDATHERFGREEGAPMILLTGDQSEQLHALEEGKPPKRRRATPRKQTRRAAKA